jgi:hypothetical protein
LFFVTRSTRSYANNCLVRLSLSAESAAIQQCFSLTINQRTVLLAIINQRNEQAGYRRFVTHIFWVACLTDAQGGLQPTSAHPRHTQHRSSKTTAARNVILRKGPALLIYYSICPPEFSRPAPGPPYHPARSPRTRGTTVDGASCRC